MDNIDKVIQYMETGVCPEPLTKSDPTEIYKIIDTLHGATYSAKEAMMVWISMCEFKRAKLTRSNAIPSLNETDKDITITVVTDAP